MIENDRPEKTLAQTNAITVTPPFIWPDCRILAGVSRYAETPPGKAIFTGADLISGVIVGAGSGTIDLLEEYLSSTENRKLVFVLVLFPAGPTRAEHLKRILTLMAAKDGGTAKAEIRLVAMEHHIVDGSEHIKLPPTVIQAHDTKTGQTVMSIGSVGDAGHDDSGIGSLNLVFQPDDAVRDEWRRWFQYLVGVSVLLKPETSDIPYLIPAKGDQEADRMWKSYKDILTINADADRAESKPQVDPQTGEIIKTLAGKPVDPWDDGATALDPLANIFQKLYSDGCLVTVDETTRIKPLAVPVLATLLGQKSEHVVGAVTRKQSFSLKILDDSIEKHVENCRKISDLTELLAYPLSKGNRWLPNQAKPLLEKEVEARNAQGKKALWKSLLGQSSERFNDNPVLAALAKSGFSNALTSLTDNYNGSLGKLDTADKILQAIIDSQDEANAKMRSALVRCYTRQILDSKKASYTKDLNQMYRELGQGECVPPDKLAAVLEAVEKRLENALGERITPRPVYNQIAAPGLTNAAPSENWTQPLALLTCAATTIRESLTDPYFSRNFKNRTFSKLDYLKAMDVLADTILQTKDTAKAQDELHRITEINESAANAKQKCQDLWNLIKKVSDAD